MSHRIRPVTPHPRSTSPGHGRVAVSAHTYHETLSLTRGGIFNTASRRADGGRPPVEQHRTLLRSIAAAGLADVEHAVPKRPLPDEGFTDLVEDVASQRLHGHLWNAVSTGLLPATADQRETARQIFERATFRVMQLDYLLLRVLDLLTEQGIGTRVLKGAAIARTVYPRPSDRVFVDVDVLVPPGELSAAAEVLAGAGLARHMPELSPGFDDRFAKGVLFLDPSGRQVDLHRSLVLGPFRFWIRLGDLFATTRPFDIAGRTCMALGAEEQFLNICYHAALGARPPRLVPLRDVAQTLLNDTLDIARLRGLAKSWRGEVVVAQAIKQAWEVLRIDTRAPLVTWAFEYSPTCRERLALRSYRSGNEMSVGEAFSSLFAIDSASEKLAYARSYLFPSEEFLERRGLSLLSWWNPRSRHSFRQPEEGR